MRKREPGSGFHDIYGNEVPLHKIETSESAWPNSESPDYFGLVDPDKLWRAVRSLPPKQRFVIRCRVIEQLTLKEVGELMGISNQAVSRLEQRATKALAARLTGWNA